MHPELRGVRFALGDEVSVAYRGNPVGFPWVFAKGFITEHPQNPSVLGVRDLGVRNLGGLSSGSMRGGEVSELYYTPLETYPPLDNKSITPAPRLPGSPAVVTLAATAAVSAVGSARALDGVDLAAMKGKKGSKPARPPCSMSNVQRRCSVGTVSAATLPVSVLWVRSMMNSSGRCPG